jgi:glycosyl transferase family 25
MNSMNFPPVFVINLDDRKDRWDEIKKAFESWPIKLERISAIKETPGWKGCLKSHKKAVKYALDHNYPWVLVLEDDCLPANGHTSFTQFLNTLPYLWENRDKWDIFSGGPTVIYESNVFTKDPILFNVKSYGAHFMLINQKVYENIIRAPEEPIDVFYKNKLSCLCSYPHIAYQKEGVSDIEGKEVDYKELFNTSAKQLRKQLYGNVTEYLLAGSILLALLVLKGIYKRK